MLNTLTVLSTLCMGFLGAACSAATPRGLSSYASVDAAGEWGDGVTNGSGLQSLDRSTHEGASLSDGRDSGVGTSDTTTVDQSVFSEHDAASSMVDAGSVDASEMPSSTADELDASIRFFDASDASAVTTSNTEQTVALTGATPTSVALTNLTAARDGGVDSVDSSAWPRDAGRPKDASVIPLPVGGCPAGPYPASPIPSTVVFTPLCSGLTFGEGPVWVASESRLYFSDFDNGAPGSNYDGNIVRYTPNEGCAVWLANVGSNGLALGTDGELVACRHTTQTVTAYDRQTQEPTPLASSYQGSNFSSPNDLAVRSDGNIYFSDPAWNLGNRTQELPQAVYRINPAGTVSLIEELPDRRPNGVALSPDESVLYVALSNEIRTYDLDPFGAATNPRTFLNVGSDGLAVDCAGNLYVTSGGIRIYAPNSELLGSLSASGNVTNMAFGGAEGRTLFITGGSSLRSVDLTIAGL